MADADLAGSILEREYLRSTGLVGHELRTAEAIFDENADKVVCPACGAGFPPCAEATCPECGLQFGR